MTLYPKLHRWIQQPRVWRAVLFPLLILIMFLATSSDPYPVPASNSDKVNHIIAFAGLGVIFRWSYPRALVINGLILLVAYGLLIEVVQAFLPYRDFSLLDLLADALGAAVGLMTGSFLLRGRPSQKSQANAD